MKMTVTTRVLCIQRSWRGSVRCWISLRNVFWHRTSAEWCRRCCPMSALRSTPNSEESAAFCRRAYGMLPPPLLDELTDNRNKKHLKNVGPIHYCEPPHAHSSGVASGTVVRCLRIDVHDADDNDNVWQRGPLWPHGMGPMSIKKWVSEWLLMFHLTHSYHFRDVVICSDINGSQN